MASKAATTQESCTLHGGIAPTIMTAQGGNRMPMTILAHKAGEANRYDVRHPKNNNQHRQSLEQ